MRTTQSQLGIVSNMTAVAHNARVTLNNIRADADFIAATFMAVGVDPRIEYHHIRNSHTSDYNVFKEKIENYFGVNSENLCVWLKDGNSVFRAQLYSDFSIISEDLTNRLMAEIHIECDVMRLAEPVLGMSWKELGVPEMEMKLPLDNIRQAVGRTRSWHDLLQSVPRCPAPKIKAALGYPVIDVYSFDMNLRNGITDRIAALEVEIAMIE